MTIPDQTFRRGYHTPGTERLGSKGDDRDVRKPAQRPRNRRYQTPQSGGGFLQRLLDNTTFAFGETRTASSSAPSFRNLAGPPDDGSRPLPPDDGGDGENTPPDGGGSDNPDEEPPEDDKEPEEKDCPQELLDRVAFLERHKAEVSERLNDLLARQRELQQKIEDLKADKEIGIMFGMLDLFGRGLPSIIRRVFGRVARGRISADPEGETNSPNMSRIEKELEEARTELRVLQKIVIPEAMERLRRVGADLQDAIDDAKAAGCYGSDGSSSPNGPTT